MPSLPLVTREMLSLLEAEIARHRAAAVPQPKPAAKPAPTPSKFITGVYSPVDQMFAPRAAPAVAAPKAKPALAIAPAKTKPAHERIAKAKPPVPPPKPTFRPTPDADGNVKITILKPGFATPAGRQVKMGETIDLPAEQAAQVALSRSGDYSEAM